ncbi:hypothetical protein PRIPAC_90039 [Pristionchus pacificus]|uniref:Chromo domain-containing protein n=1 Tax=Pristionchus pacificus TaxID=54126 RepID=A0A454XVS2_PRIPA|nr:hypothetical protein PRIPAC_90039 [Pristionchus pacificus]|eukprot:PDM82018.1 hypothetical protein PRIPAC_36411 [Pristionchus pacificus]
MATKKKSALATPGRKITIEVNADGEALYDVQEIHKMRLTVDGDAEFLVKWKGYKTPTWEPLCNLDSSSPMMVAFMSKVAASGKPPRVFTPRKSTGPSTPRRAASGSAKNTPTKPSTPTRPVRHVQLKTIDTREREAALARARREQAEAQERDEKEQEGERDEEEKEENDAADERRVQKRPRLEENEEEAVQVPKRARQDEVVKKVEEKKGRCSIM